MKQRITTKKIVLVGMFAALTVAGSGIRITMPVSIAGTTAFHLGNIFCALSGILLGPWLGGLAAGLGSASYDMVNPMYIAECWLTFLMKGAYALMAGLVAWSGRKEWKYGKATLAAVSGAVAYAVLYLVISYYKAAFIQGAGAAGGWITVAEKMPATVFNAAVAIVFAPMLAVPIRTALKRNHLTLE